MKMKISRSLNADRCSYIDCVGFSRFKKNATIDFPIFLSLFFFFFLQWLKNVYSSMSTSTLLITLGI